MWNLCTASSSSSNRSRGQWTVGDEFLNVMLSEVFICAHMQTCTWHTCVSMWHMETNVYLISQNNKQCTDLKQLVCSHDKLNICHTYFAHYYVACHAIIQVGWKWTKSHGNDYQTSWCFMQGNVTLYMREYCMQREQCRQQKLHSHSIPVQSVHKSSKVAEDQERLTKRWKVMSCLRP